MLKLTDAIDKYNRCLQSDRAAKDTIRTHISAVRRFCGWSSLEHVEEITADTAMAYKEFLSNSSGGKSINLYMSFLRSFFNRLREDGYIETDIAKFFRDYKRNVAQNLKGERQQKYGETVKKFIPREHQLKIYREASKTAFGRRNKLMFETALTCGLREHEVVRLQVSNVDGNEKTLKNIIGKGNKMRNVPILKADYLKELLAYIRSHGLKDDDYIFSANGKKGSHLSTRTFDRVFREVLEAANLPSGRENDGYTTHDMRGTFITAMLEEGLPLHDVAQIVGHSDWNVTAGYYRPHSGEEKRANMERIMKTSVLA